MIRGNEKAIDLGLEILASLNPERPLSKTEIAEVIEAMRQEVGGARKPFTKQDLFFLEDSIATVLSFDEVRGTARCRCGLYAGHPGFHRGTDPRSYWSRDPFVVRIGHEAAQLKECLRKHGSLTVRQIRNLLGLRLRRAKAVTQRLRAEGVILCTKKAHYSYYELAA